jgi:predicted DNA-binding protein (UPF0278 family)
MKTGYLFAGIILLIALITLLIMNISLESNINLLYAESLHLNTWIVLLLGGLFGAGGAAAIGAYFVETTKEKLSKHSRVAEKASIKAEESTDKVKALEAKIQTLEQALQKALKNK